MDAADRLYAVKCKDGKVCVYDRWRSMLTPSFDHIYDSMEQAQGALKEADNPDAPHPDISAVFMEPAQCGPHEIVVYSR